MCTIMVASTLEDDKQKYKMFWESKPGQQPMIWSQSNI